MFEVDIESGRENLKYICFSDRPVCHCYMNSTCTSLGIETLLNSIYACHVHLSLDRTIDLYLFFTLEIHALNVDFIRYCYDHIR